MKKLICIIILLFASTCIALKAKIQKALNYAAAQNMTVEWLDSKTDVEVYQYLNSNVTLTADEKQALKMYPRGLREILRKDAVFRRNAQRTAAVKSALDSLEYIRYLDWGNYIVITVDGSDPNDV